MAPNFLELAEAPGAFVLPPHPAVVHGDGYLTLPRGPGLLTVQRVRLTPDRLDAARAEIRARAREIEAQRIEWALCELSEPANVAKRLGLERSETLAAVALTSAPPAGGAFEVREVQTLEDFTDALTVDAIANDWPADAGAVEQYTRTWEASLERFVMWLALDDGRPVGMARCAACDGAFVMLGGAVLPGDRGRGAYGALIAARWESAVARRLGALVTAANANSAPILRRLGFAELGEIAVYIDTP